MHSSDIHQSIKQNATLGLTEFSNIVVYKLILIMKFKIQQNISKRKKNAATHVNYRLGISVTL